MRTGPKGRSGSTGSTGRKGSGSGPRGRPPVRPPGKRSGALPAKPAPARSGPQTDRPAPLRARPGRAAPLVLPGVEVIAGRNAVREALRAGKRVRQLLLLDTPDREAPADEAVSLARQRGVPVERLPREQLDALAPEHQGMVAIATPYQYANWTGLLERFRKAARPPSVLLLDTLHDPQNLGTLLRTCEATGVDAVVLPRHRSVHVTASVVRSSAGAIEHLAVTQVPNLSRAVEELQAAGFWVVGVDAEGTQQFWEVDMAGPTAVVLGGEDHGIGRALKEKCDFLVRLPMSGKVNSLNAATAGSVVLYELARQRLAGKGTAVEGRDGRGIE